MPQISVRGVRTEDIATMSAELSQKLANIFDTTVDNLFFQEEIVRFYSLGECVDLYPLIEIKLFDRGTEVEKSVYETIKNYLENKGYKDIEVYFIHLEERSYFY